MVGGGVYCLTISRPATSNDVITYVLDTSVLLSDPTALFQFEENRVVIPLVVLTELEAKRHHPDLGWAARQALRSLEDIRIAHGQLGMVLAAGLINQTGIHAGTTLALLGYREWKFLSPILFGDTLKVRVTIENKRETKKPDRGILMRKIEILNQRDELVQEGYADLMVKRKP